MQNEAMVPVSHYSAAEIYNRIGQYFYRIGDIEKAKVLFILSNVYSGNFELALPA